MRTLTLALAAAATLLVVAPSAFADSKCPERARCGSVVVPLDRAQPAAGTTKVAYALVARRDTSTPSQGTVVYNPGGPGGSPIAVGDDVAHAFGSLLEHRELLLVDPRGTGQSDALHCRGTTDAALAFATRDQFAKAAGACGRELGPRAAYYGSDAVAEDFDAVRAALGIDKLDLWGESYGTYLMPFYAARHPEHVRSIMLSGAYPIAFDPWGRDRLGAARRAIRLVCARTHRCDGDAVLRDVRVVAARLRQHPDRSTVKLDGHRYPLRVDEAALAGLVYADGDPEVYGVLPPAVRAARRGDLARLRKLVAQARIQEAQLIASPAAAAFFNPVQSFATMCRDYPRLFAPGQTIAQRRAAYRSALGKVDPAGFAPFSPKGWMGAGFESGNQCLYWPGASMATPQVGPLPDVPTLVVSGDLDANTPSLAGRQTARQFPHAAWVEVPNIGHTPTDHGCGLRLAKRFVETLRVHREVCR